MFMPISRNEKMGAGLFHLQLISAYGWPQNAYIECTAFKCLCFLSRAIIDDE